MKRLGLAARAIALLVLISACGSGGAPSPSWPPPPRPGTPAELHAAASSACAAMPLRTTGTVHYFCACDPGAQPGCEDHAGDDGWDGLDPDHSRGGMHGPKSSWVELVNTFNGMSAGDTIALCQGGAWAVGARLDLRNAACAAGEDLHAAANPSTCDVRDYPTAWGNAQRPRLQLTADTHLLSFASGAPQRGVRILNLALHGGGDGPAGPGEEVVLGGQRGLITQGDNTDFLVCNDTFDGFFVALHVLPEPAPAARIVIRGNRITNSTAEGFLGGASDSAIDANVFEDAGSSSAGSHAIYLQGQSVARFELVNNQFLRTAAPPPCGGAIVVVHDQYDGLNIENNHVDGGAGSVGACYGIAVDAGGYPRPGWYRHLTIRRNRVERAGYAPIHVANAPAPIIENNLVVSGMTGAGLGIHVPGLAARTSPADDRTTAAVVRNNTIFFPAAAAGSTGIQLGDVAEGTGYVVANNAIVFAGGGGTCLDLSLPADRYAYVDHNLCSGFTRWEATRGSLEAWRTYGRDRFDGASRTDAPQLASPPGDLTPAGGSPLLGAGDAARAPAVDQALRTRPDPPSIGALER